MLDFSLRLAQESEIASMVNGGLAIRYQPHLAPHRATRGGFQEDAFWRKKKKMKWGWGGGRCQKSETKKLRHDSKPGCGVARRPGAAAGRRASTWQGPPSWRPFPVPAPRDPGSPAEGTVARGTEGLTEGGGPKAQWRSSLWGLTGGEATDLISLFLLKLRLPGL